MEPDRHGTTGGPGSPPMTVPVLSLLVANLATIILAVFQDWDLGTVIFIYWFQSVIIGVFTAARILSLDPIPGSDGRRLWSGGLLPEPAGKAFPNPGPSLAKVFLAGFFLLHYGFFHWGYYTFLADFGMLRTVNLENPDLLVACGLFVANHLYSFLYYQKREVASPGIVKDLITGPYQRILPMHLTIMFAGVASLALPFTGIDPGRAILFFFLAMKTWVDVKGHMKKHGHSFQVPS